MERDTVVKEVVEALKIFSRDIRTQIDEMGSQLRAEMQQFRAEVNERFDRLEQKFAGLRVELTETQETVHFLASKTIQHEKKLHHLAKQLESIR
ncbi:hypothetical protein CV945_05770 [Geobacillus sp. Manikaran-105]|uniref:hypothetical protein n=1 Tax=Geobacillus sp. Manikaran-105 TaxID=2055940 RepID=UPI000C28EE54|nr:hypothetical protein [Geobacillus sp. Manikaran-105]PJW15039.1 hypothetical protein CV945_05770 [Geobacillus sp. Manikaran-105]